jgi:IPT/TIG domain
MATTWKRETGNSKVTKQGREIGRLFDSPFLFSVSRFKSLTSVFSVLSLLALLIPAACQAQGQISLKGSVTLKGNITMGAGGARLIRLSPNSGLVGSSFTITGANFGPAQGTSTITLNNVPFDVEHVTFWSNNAITVVVPSGATSGNVVVIVGNLASNALFFTVTHPTITFLSPASARANDYVIVSGADLGSAPPDGQVTFAGVPATVPVGGWTNTSITAVVPVNATSGPVVVTIGNFSTNAVDFTLLPPGPVISTIDPPVGTTGINVTLTGSNFGSSQGASTVTVNGVTAYVCSTCWADGQITFTVPGTLTPGTMPVIVTVNGQKSNGVGYTIPFTGAANSISISPPTMSMLVGDSRQISVVDDFGRVLTPDSLTVADPTIAQISTDGTQTLTGLLAGSTTVTATYQGLTSPAAVVTVTSGTSLTPGTVRWEVPPAPGFTTTNIVQALPAQNMPAFYSIEQEANPDLGITTTLVRALSVDGGTLWVTKVAGTDDAANPAFAVHNGGDAFGGVLVQVEQYTSSPNATYSTIIRYDGATGQESWRYSSPGKLKYDWAVRSDGMIFVVEENDSANEATLLGIDGATGLARTRVPILESTWEYYDSSCSLNIYQRGPAQTGAPIITPDGAVHLEGDVWHRLDGQTQCLGASENSTYDDNVGGLLASRAVCQYNYNGYYYYCFPHLSHVTAGGNTDYAFALDPGMSEISSMVLGENGTAFASDGAKFVSFNVATGAVNWTWTAPSAGELIASTAGNGLAVKQYNFDGSGSETDQVVRLDPTGQATYDAWTGNSIQYAYAGEWLALGTSEGIHAPDIDVALAVWPFASGGPMNQNSPTQNPYPFLLSCLDSNLECVAHGWGSSTGGGPREWIYNALSALEVVLGKNCVPNSTDQWEKQACNIDQFVFTSALKDANLNQASRAGFLSFLSTKHPQFFDGTRSTLRRCGNTERDCSDSALVSYDFLTQGVSAETIASDAWTPPNIPGMKTFFNPRAIYIELPNPGLTSVPGPNDYLNMATVFHEALHAYTRLIDAPNLLVEPPTTPSLKLSLGCSLNYAGTYDITRFLSQFTGPTAYAPTTVDACSTLAGDGPPLPYN